MVCVCWTAVFFVAYAVTVTVLISRHEVCCDEYVPALSLVCSAVIILDPRKRS